LLGSIGIALFLGLSPILTIPILIITGIIANYNSASRDVAVDGIMCVDGKETNTCDKIQAIQWILITVASIFVGLGGGYIAQHYTYKVAYLCLVPIYLIIIGIILNYKNNAVKVIQQRENVLTTLYSYKELFTNKSFLFACLFLFLYKFSPSFGTPLSYIERDIFKWSAQWMGTLGAIVSCFEIAGAIVFFKFCKKLNIKKWLYISVFLGAITSLSYLYFTPITAVLYGIIYSILGMFIHLIVMSFMAKATIKGKEATSFALLCSISNLSAGTLSSLTGAFLYPIMGLKILIILSSITSFFCLPLIKGIINEEK